MRKKILPFFAIATMLVFSACSNEDILQETNTETTIEAARKISVTASLNEEPTTYLGLEETADKNIVLTWEVGDALQLVFVQGTDKAASTVTLTAEDITNDSKKASFDIAIPSEIDGTETFKLYGVFGGGGINLGDASNPNPYAILPTDAGKTNLLSDVEARKHVMLHFESEITPQNPQVSVNFQHLGSLFSISFLNSGPTSISTLTQMRLLGVDVNGVPLEEPWAYNTDDGGGQKYDLVEGKFLVSNNPAEPSFGIYISFNAAGINFPVGVPVTLWGWYPIIPDKDWPALRLQLFGGDPSNILGASINIKPAKTTPEAGKRFRFYAALDESQIFFTNSTFTELSPAPLPTP